MKLQLTTDRILIAVIALLLLTIATVTAISISESRQVSQTTKMVSRTNYVLQHAEELMTSVRDNESGARGYMLTGQKAFLDQVERSKKRAEEELLTLKSLTADGAKQQQVVDSLIIYVRRRLAYSEKNISTYDNAGQNVAMEAVRSGEGRLMSEQVRRFVDNIKGMANVLLEQRKKMNEDQSGILVRTLSICAIGILLLMGIFVLTVRADYLKKKKTAADLARMNIELEGRVKKRTLELTESKKVLTETFERITDAFVSFDSKWNFTYVNKRAGEIFNYPPTELIGKNIWKTFPEAKERPSFAALQQAMETQHYVYLETHHRETGLWFENHVYPSPDGLSVFFKDITEKKRAEQILKASEEKYRLLIGRISDAFIALDKDWHFVFANKAFGELTQRDPDSLIGKIIWEEFPEAVGLPTYNLFHKALQEQRYMFNEDYYGPLDLWHENYVYPSSEGISVFIKNITERKKAEQKIMKANRLYFFISQVNQMIVRTSDQETLFAEACRIAVELGKFRMAWIGLIDETTQNVVPVRYAGYDESYLSLIKPVSVREVPEGLGPTGRAIREGKYHICNDIEQEPLMGPWKDEALSRGYRSSMSLPIIKFGKVIGAFSLYAGEKNFFDESEIALLVEATGDVSFALEVFEKESQRQKAEQGIVESERRYHTLAEVSPVGIFHTDETGYTTYVNPRWCQISGMTYQAAMGNGWFDAVHKEDRGKLQQGWEEATKKKEVSVSEYRFVRPNGTIAWVIGQAIPERDADGNIIGYVGTTTDITERKKYEKELQESSEKLRQLTAHLLNVREEERKRIGREIHDELGQQLTAIKMDVSWISKKTDPGNEVFKTKLQNVITLLDGGNQSIRRILNELRPVILDDYGLLEALKWQAKQFSNNTGIPVSFKTSESQVRIREDIATCVFRVFQEALTNITRYAKAKNVVVSLDIDEESILLNIEDDGIGFDTELTNTKMSFGILGMKERVFSLNGNFSLISSPGKGTKVRVNLPLKNNNK